MTELERRSRIGRPWRRLKRWARHTPNGDMALMLVCVGIALIFVAVIAAVTIV
ncbi:hypothetical protein [uncultured Jatrophihabitans sp.]|uniref:hypothetical protein n=1 Tax=uncultured Jatrophihabitans sp. TaxID=1610747 RepID=UPI0035CB6456